MTHIKRSDICYISSGGNTQGSEQRGCRPAVIIQNNVGNKYSPTVIVALITKSTTKSKMPTHVEILPNESGLTSKSLILLEQIRTIDKGRILRKVSSLTEEKMTEVDKALEVSLGFCEGY